MPVLRLVRHGQASFGADDYDVLSETGRTQSTVVGEELLRRGLRDPAVVSGTLRRQRDTASLAGAAAGLSQDPVVDGRWDEYDPVEVLRLHGGGAELDGSSRGLQEVLDTALAAWVEADEGWAGFAGGAVSAVTELAAAGRDALVFTSGGVVAAVAAWLLGLPAAGVVAANRVMVNASVTTLAVGRSGVSLVSFNEHAHLEARGLVTYR